MYCSLNTPKLLSADLNKKKHGVKKDGYFITKVRSPKNKAMSLAILANNFQDLSKEIRSIINVYELKFIIKVYESQHIAFLATSGSKRETTE